MLQFDRSGQVAACFASLLLSVSSAAAERPVEPGTNPLGGSGAGVLERVPDQPAASRQQRIVFTCVAPGLTTFSDRPCGPLPERRSLDLPVVAGKAPGEVASVVPRRAAASTKPAVNAGQRDARPSQAADGAASNCDQLRHTVAVIDRQMRAGYSARDAPRLWERWRDAKDRLHAAGCR